MKKPSTSLRTPNMEWLRLNYKLLLTAFLIAFVSFPKFDLFYSSGIDESLPWVFNYFADGHYNLSQNLIFPHGRLAFLMYPLAMGNNYVVAIVVTFFCSMLFTMNMFRLFSLKQTPYVNAVVLLLVIHCMIDLQLLLIGVTFSSLLLFSIHKKQTHLFTAVFFSALALYVKSYCAAICGMTLAAACLPLLYKDKNIKLCLKVISVYALFFVLGWLALYQSFGGILTFFTGQMELSANNSEAACLYNSHDWWLLGIGLICLLSLGLIKNDPLARRFFWMMLPALFAAWKHSMARSDGGHLASFVAFVVFFVFSFFLIAKNPGTGIIAAGIISISTFMLNITSQNIPFQKDMALFKPYNLFDPLFNYGPMITQRDRMTQACVGRLHLPDTMLKIIGKNTADVYPWNYSILPVNQLNWQPRPVLQSYAAYSSWLDEQDAAHFRSPGAARFLIWEINKTPDGFIKKMESIDGRYLLNDEPKSMFSLFSNYALRYKGLDYLLFEKQETSNSMKALTLSKPFVIHPNEWVNVPACDPGCVLRAKLKVHKNFRGAMLSFLYKGEDFRIDYQLDNEEYTSHRIVIKNAADGLWLYPFVRDPSHDTIEPLVKRIKFISSDTTMADTRYTLQFEQTRFNFRNGAANFGEAVFNKKLRPAVVKQN